MATDVLSLPIDQMPANRCVLRQEVPALQLIATDNGHARWGPLIRLPRGAELQEFGEGFDDQTLRVRCDGCFYIIFNQDLASAQKSPAQKRSGHNAA